MAIRPPHPTHDAAAAGSAESHPKGTLTLVPPAVPPTMATAPATAMPRPSGAFGAATSWALAPLVGRDELAASIEALVLTERMRLVTLTGPGGVGKTRLALHLLERLRPGFRDGAAFVSLASIRDPEAILPAIAAGLGLTESPGRPLANEFRRWVQGRDILLVLDNLEQVLDGAPALAATLADAPGLALLVTSRAPLAVSGEQRIVVPPLEVPGVGDDGVEAIRARAAVRLFEDRARRIDPRFAITPQNAGTVGAICARLDGLPLALELAAARTTILSPAALLARLTDRFRVLSAAGSDRPERHRTLRQAIAWTYDLLPETGQRMLRLLAAFEDGWSVELVEALERTALWSRWFPGALAIDLLHDLVDQSLVQVRQEAGDGGEPRFLMLETVRAFAREDGIALGEDDAIRAAHLEAVLAFAQAYGPQLDSPDRDARQRRIDPEWENIRAAHAWALAHGRPAQALRLASAVWHACEVKGHYTLGRAWHESAMAALPPDPLAPASPDDVPLNPAEWRTARLTAAFLIEDRMDPDAAEPLFQAVLAEASAADARDPRLAIQATLGLGLVAQARADLDRARAWFEKTARLAREADEPRLEAIAINVLGRLAFLRMDIAEAGHIFSRARAVAESIGDRRLEARYLNNLAVIAMEEGDPARAEGLLAEATACYPAGDDAAFRANLLTNQARLLTMRGDHAGAEARVREALATLAPMEMPGGEAYLQLDLAEILRDQGEPAKALATLTQSLARGRTLDDPALLTLAVLALARLAAHQERWPVAAEAFDLSDRLRMQIGMAWSPRERALLAPVRARVGAAVPPDQILASVVDPGLLAPDGRLDLAAVRDRVDALAARLGEPAPDGIAARPAGTDAARPPAAPADRATTYGLTAREMEVLALLGRGASTTEIADELSISIRTVTTHVSHILGKLGVTSRAAAAAFAARNGVA